MGLKIELPSWATEDPNNPMRVKVDSAVAYPEILDELGIEKKDIDQYWLEVAYQCIKMDIQTVKGISGLHISMSNAPEFAQKNFKPGLGPHAATKGKQARGHYERTRGTLPKARQDSIFRRMLNSLKFN